MLKADNISKAYTGEPLFEGVAFTVAPGERVGLIGRNGHGKTTLLRIISGAEAPDTGIVTVPRGYAIGWLDQRISFDAPTVLEEASKGLKSAEDGSDLSYKAKAILQGLGIPAEMFALSPDKLSGGLQVRLKLARVLVSEPDLLLLDEPTNYLDIVSLRWLKGFLNSWPGAVILVTHDRGFMDSVVTHTLSIHRGSVRKLSGDTRKAYTRIAEDEELHERTRKNREKKHKEAERFIERFRAKAAKASQVQSRIKALEREERLDKLEEIKTMDCRFSYRPTRAKRLLSVDSLSFAYPGAEPLIDGLSFSAGPGERIAVVGKNGLGKSTLLKVLAGELHPRGGTVEFHPGAGVAHFGQTNVERLDPEVTVEEELIRAEPDMNRTAARGVCAQMLFEGDQALKKIGVLSGGEKSRVLLGRLLLSPSNVLLLDEPTNHLDMESTEAFVQAIEAFEGAVVMVTHSESILERTATALVVFDRSGVKVFACPYREFVEKVGWEDDPDPGETAGRDEKPMSKKDIRRARAEVTKERSRALGPLKKRMEEIEREISTLEARLEEVEGELIRAGAEQDGECISRLSAERHELESRIEGLFEELEGAHSEYSVKCGEFESALEEIGEAGP